MAVSLTCTRCHELITADDEDELVAEVQAHARDHGGAHGEHVPTRERILAHLRRHDPEED
jgi:predicted small metal-binding protein